MDLDIYDISNGLIGVRSVNEERLEWITGRYPDPDITPAEFETFVAEVLSAAIPTVSNFTVNKHEIVIAADGEYDFDATVRFELLGARFLVLVEAKKHSNPIKRELVQTLHAKLQSTGAQKAIMISTSRYQGGAVQYAKAHGIALVKVTEGRFIYETRAGAQPLPLTRDEAAAIGVPTFVAHHYYKTEGGLGSTLICTDHVEGIQELLNIVANH